MFDFKLMNRGMADEALTPSAKVMLYYVINALGMTDDGKKVLSDGYISSSTKLSMKTIVVSRDILIKNGYLTVERLKNKYGTISLSYRLKTDDDEGGKAESTVTHKEIRESGDVTVESFLSDF